MTLPGRQVLALDAGWRFQLGDIDPPLPNTHLAAYMLNKAGYARGAAKPGWDDSDWRAVDLPHDWSVEGEFSPDNHVDAGFLPRGVAWYRRHFALDESDRGRHLSITFDGVATHCTVFVNGHLLHRNFCGYTPFTIDITDVARYGEDDVNTIAVRVDATYAEGWWYEGAGIYRHVWLTKSHPLHVRDGSLFVYAEQRADGWLTKVSLTLENTSDVDVHYRLASDLLDPDGKELVISGDIGILVRPRSTRGECETLPIRSPRLWSVDSPTLYKVRTRLTVEDELVEEHLTPVGFRTIRFDPDHGFFLNDQSLKLKGTCVHQDHAGVGVAVPDSIQEFRVRRLKEMGCNAIRCAHHPPARELLDACDRLGMLVMDENRNFGSSPQHLEQLRAMVRRDRNHPSVVLWSICNEEAIQGTPVAANIARAMTHEVEKLDPSRPVMAAVSGGILNDDGLAAAMPLVGINYQLPVNDQFRAKHPDVSIVAAETHCVLSTRGTYETDATRFVFASDDTETAPWGATARETWRFVSSRPYLAGLFAWTGFDYRGEPTPHGWPCVSSQFGMMDLCGFEKDAFFLHKAFFTPTGEPFVHLLPHWNSPGRADDPVRVRVYSNCDAVELFLNGESLGRRAVDLIEMAEWTVNYRPGVLAAVGYREGRQVAEARVETTGPGVSLGLEVHPSARVDVVPADGHFALPVTVFAVDAQGRRVPTAEPHVTFALDGPGRIIGVGNGDPTSHEPNRATSRTLFRGLAQMIVQTTTSPGPISLVAHAPRLASASLQFASVVAARPVIPPARRKHFLTDWRMGPVTPTRPDARQQVLAQDVNSWDRVEPGRPQAQWEHARGYAVYRAKFTPPKSVQSHGGRIVFRSVAGTAEVFVNDVAAAAKSAATARSIEVAVPASQPSVTVSLVLGTDAPPAGLVGLVEVLAATP
jgi:beta-galactosidase